MRIVALPLNPVKYSCNVYYILGDWNKIDDLNTLIDVGTDDYIIPYLEEVPTGIGQKKVSQVIITHEHFDHKGGLAFVKKKFNPKVFAYNKNNFVDVIVQDGMEICIGDRKAILIHTPGHSNDSISIFVPDEGVLFSGDLPFGMVSRSDTYTLTYLNTIRKLSQLEIKDIYPGHGNPIIGTGSEIIKRTLEIVEHSKIIE